VKKILKLKTVCFLAYCHNMLLEAEEQDKQDKGILVIKDGKELEETRALGKEVIKFLEDNNCTKDFLSFNLKQELRPRAKKYYEDTIRVYYKYFGDRIIPLLFAITGLELLEERKIISVDANLLDRVKQHFIKSEHLEKKVVKIGKFERVRSVEVLKYSDCIEDILNTLDKSKPPKKTKRRK